MKKIYKLLLAVLMTLSMSASLWANDTITFTWSRGVKSFQIAASLDDSFTVYWGDGASDSYQQSTKSPVSCSHSYLKGILNVTVTIIGGKNCAITGLNIDAQSMSSLDVSKAENLVTLVCSGNNLSSLNLTQNTQLTGVDIKNNLFRISTLPVKKAAWTTYTYAPQQTWTDNNPITYIDGIDLRSEYSIEGKTLNRTNYSWFDITGGSEVAITSGITATFGRFTLASSFAGKTLRCKMTNADFPALASNPIIYEVTVNALGDYNEEDKAALRAFLRQPSSEAAKCNALQLGLALSDTAGWKTDETWITKVEGLTWNTEIPKRLTKIEWEGKYIAGNLDVSSCPALKTLYCYITAITALDVSKCTALTYLYCNNTAITTLDVSNCTALQTLYCYYTAIPTLDVSKCTALKTLACHNIAVTALDVSKCTALTYLSCNNTAITTLDISKNTALKTLYCNNTNLKFSTLPLALPVGGENYSYSPQNKINGGNIPYNAGINLSAEHNINGKTTTYAWYEVNGGTETAITLSGSNGIFTLTAAHAGKTLRCKMSNAQFPNFSGNNLLVYEVSVDPLLFAGGEGTQADPYQIETVQQLDSVRYFLDKHYILKNNIDLDAFITAKYGTDGWKPIGDNTTPFSGQFHGSGYAVSNLHINRPATDYIGLFGYIAAPAKVDSLGIINADIKGKDKMGSMAGYLLGSLTACYATGNIQSFGSYYIGGLVGINQGPITSCYTVCDVVGESAGGLVGYGGAIIENCYAMGNVRATDEYASAGGLAAAAFEGDIYQCYTTGNVEGNWSVGGIAGRTEGYLGNCVAANPSLISHRNDGNYTINRIVGDDEGTFSNNYAWENMLVNGSLRNSSNPNSTDGANKSWTDLQKQNTYTSISSQWNFTNTWSIWEGNSLPYFKWQSSPASVSGVSATQISGLVQNAALTDSIAFFQIKNGMQYVGKTNSFTGNNFTFTFPVALNKGDTLSVVVYEKNKSRSYPVQARVPNAVTAFDVVQDTVSVLITKSLQLAYQFTPFDATDQGIVWESKNTNIASVDNAGKITAKTGGNTWIIATTVDGGFKDSVLVKVDNLCGGTGSQAQPLLICTAEELNQVREFLDNDSIHFRLANDIDLTDFLKDSIAGWLPIGANSNYYFSGQIHGGGHVITGLRINRPNDDAGLLNGTYAAALIDSLGVEIAGGDSIKGRNAGGLVEYNGGTISHCYVSGLIIGTSSGLSSSTGGLAGSNSGLISHCYTLGEVRSNSENTGGLVGRNYKTITSCYSTSHVNANGAGNSVYAGGLVGYHGASSGNTAKIEYSYATGNVSAVKDGAYTGGLAGYMYNSVIENNIAANLNLDGTGSYINRILGRNNTGTLANNYALDNMKVKGTVVSGGFHHSSIQGGVKSISELHAQATYTGLGWNFTSAWMIWESKSHPYFQYQSAPVANAKAVAGGLTFDLRNNIEKIKVFNPRTRTESNFTRSLTAGTQTLVYASEPNDTLLVMVYEAGKTLSYPVSVVTQTSVYNEHDKEALRAFLRQPSSEAAKCNAQQLGLVVSDTANWYTDEAWVAKVEEITWNNETPKRLTLIDWNNKLIAGNLNVSPFAALIVLHCYVTAITALDVSENAALQDLVCRNTAITALDLTKCMALRYLSCDNTAITALDVSQCTALVGLSCFNTAITALDVSKCTALEQLYCYSTAISTLDITKCTILQTLYCYNTSITALDVTQCTALKDLRIDNTTISTLDISKNIALTTLTCFNTAIIALDVSQCPNLKFLYCENTNLKFSTLPLALPVSGGTYRYSPQNKINGGNINYQSGIDLSTEYNINGKTTTYTWYEVNGSTETAITLNGSNGIFTLMPAHVGKTLRCKMSNAQFPDFSGNNLLVYEANIVGTLPTYKVTANTGIGGNITPVGDSMVVYGNNIAYTITPNTGYKIAQVLVDGVNDASAVTNGTYTFNNVTATHTIAANFEKLTYKITASVGTNGTITPVGDSMVAYGNNITYTITPNTGYKIAQVLVDGTNDASAVTNGTYTFNNVTATHTIAANFEKLTYKITASAGTNGTITPVGDSMVTYGNNIAYTITPNTGYKISEVLIDGVNDAETVTNGTYTFSNVTATHTITASFEKLTYKITASVGTNGTITPIGDSMVAYGNNIVYTITPNTGYKIAQVLVDGTNDAEAVTNGTYTFNNVTATHTITANFEKLTYKITASAGTNGSITPIGDSMVTYGNNIIYTITPNTGYKIAQVLVDGTNDASAVTNGAYTFSNVTATHTIAASFEKLTYKVTASAGTNGTITPVGDSMVAYGNNIVYTITPNTGYKILQILIDGVNDASAVTNGTYTFNNVTATHTIAAQFEKLTYKIAASAETGGNITPVGDSMVTYGSNITYTITPNTGYKIAQVLVDGLNDVSAVTNGTYTFSNVTATHTITANFEKLTYKITASAGTGGSISPVGDSVVAYGESITYTITPNTGYEVNDVFVNGSTVGAVTTYTFSNVTANATIIASFKTAQVEQFSIISSVNGVGGTINPLGNILVNKGENQTYTITPNTGYKIAQVLVDGVNDASAVANGTYTFNNVTATHIITAQFEKITYKITAISGAGGTITPMGDTMIAHGDNITYAITAANGYEVNDVIVDGSSIGVVTSYTFTNVTSSATIIASFKKIVGINEIAGMDYKIKIYPNPVTNEKLKIEIDEWATIQQLYNSMIQLYDITGKLVGSYAITGSKTEIDIAHLPGGTYLVKVGNSTIKIVKQ